MEELINFIMTIIHFFKYDSFVNRNRSFSKELTKASHIEDERLLILQGIIHEQLTSLMLKRYNGQPKYAYFERQKENWFKIFVINNEERFYCRLRILEIRNIILPDIFYITL